MELFIGMQLARKASEDQFVHDEKPERHYGRPRRERSPARGAVLLRLIGRRRQLGPTELPRADAG